MRAADKVNVHRTAFRQHEGSNGAGIRVPQLLDKPEGHWYDKLFPSPELLMVNGRQVSGFVLPHWAAGVLLAAVLSGMGFMYSRLSDQRDMLIEMKTELKINKDHDAEYRSDAKRTMELQQVYINNLDKQLSTIKAVLTPTQIRALKSKQQEN